MRIRVQRAYEKSLQIHKKRLAAKARAKAERLASAQAEAVTAESFSKHPQALTSHLAPAADLGEGSIDTSTSPTPSKSSLLNQRMDTGICVQEDLYDFDMYHSSHSPLPQSPYVAQIPLIPPSQIVKRVRKSGPLYLTTHFPRVQARSRLRVRALLCPRSQLPPKMFKLTPTPLRFLSAVFSSEFRKLRAYYLTPLAFHACIAAALLASLTSMAI